MELCLQHPTEGYYARHDSTNEIIGARGDFVTSPEISQHFGQVRKAACALHLEAPDLNIRVIVAYSNLVSVALARPEATTEDPRR